MGGSVSTGGGSLKSRKAEDTRRNGPLDKLLAAQAHQRRKERKLVPLRIDAKTMILVRPERCTEEYAQEYREIVNQSPPTWNSVVHANSGLGGKVTKKRAKKASKSSATAMSEAFSLDSEPVFGEGIDT